MQYQIETEKPNAVAFSIPLETKAASPAKLNVIKQRLSKRLGNENEEHNLEEVESKLEKARQLRENRINETTRVLQELDSKRATVYQNHKNKYTETKEKTLGALEQDFSKHAEKRNAELQKVVTKAH